jgi:hypothetical protein
MTAHDSGHGVAKGIGLFVSHLFAIAVGVILMILGVGMGVTIVLLPAGIPVGLIGLFLVIWGACGWSEERAPVPPPSPR